MKQEKKEFSSKLTPALEYYAGLCQKRHAEKTVRKDYDAMRWFDAFLSEIDYDGGEISQELIDLWVERLSQKYAPATVKTYSGKLRGLLCSAYETNGILSPFAKTEPKKTRPAKPVFHSRFASGSSRAPTH